MHWHTMINITVILTLRMMLSYSRIRFLKDFIVKGKGHLYTIKDAIDDLRHTGETDAPSLYIEEINALIKLEENSPRLERLKDFEQHKLSLGKEVSKRLNTELRSNGYRTIQRFSLYQHLAKAGTQAKKEISLFLRTNDESVIGEATLNDLISNNLYAVAKNPEGKPATIAHFVQLLNSLEAGEAVSDHAVEMKKFDCKNEFIGFLRSLKTKKQTQRALIADSPAPAALSIPDDACHYHPGEFRTLSVREMARIQSFPDWFELRSKVTTGGQMRKFEVPQYTQVGNAVPPLLGKAIGKVVSNILRAVDELPAQHQDAKAAVEHSM